MNNKLFDKLIKLSFSMVDLPQSRSKHFSYLCQGNHIICHGYNRNRKTHPLAQKYYRYPFIHSELSAILRFPDRPVELKQCTLYNIRVNKVGQILLSRPCKNCQRLLLDFGIAKVFYSNEFGYCEELVL